MTWHCAREPDQQILPNSPQCSRTSRFFPNTQVFSQAVWHEPFKTLLSTSALKCGILISSVYWNISEAGKYNNDLPNWENALWHYCFRPWCLIHAKYTIKMTCIYYVKNNWPHAVELLRNNVRTVHFSLWAHYYSECITVQWIRVTYDALPVFFWCWVAEEYKVTSLYCRFLQTLIAFIEGTSLLAMVTVWGPMWESFLMFVTLLTQLIYY